MKENTWNLTFLTLLNTFQIIFKDYRCKECGVEGDHRLLLLFCHMEKESVHPGGYTKEHTQRMYCI